MGELQSINQIAQSNNEVRERFKSIQEQIKRETGLDLTSPGVSNTKIYNELQCEFYNNSVGNKEGYDCKLCKNRGDFYKLREYAGIWGYEISVCRCAKTRDALKNMERSGLKDIISRCTFDKYNDTEVWQTTMKNRAKKYSEQPSGSWLFMGGNPGSGKTHLCTAVAREFLLNGKEVRYMVWMEDAKKMKAAVNDAEAYGKLMQTYQKAEVLYIDDLFKPSKDQHGNIMPPSSADVQLAMEILNHRYYNDYYATIISSERFLTEIAEIDRALGGRIAEKTGRGEYALNIARDVKRDYRFRTSSVL